MKAGAMTLRPVPHMGQRPVVETSPAQSVAMPAPEIAQLRGMRLVGPRRPRSRLGQHRINTVLLAGAALNLTSAVAPRLASRVCLRLFRTVVPRAEVRDAEREVHRRAVVEELSVNGKAVKSYRWGDGTRPVLLIHGWRSRASRYAGFVSRLEASGFSPISFDAPGHGDSNGRATTVRDYAQAIRLLQDNYGPFEAVIAYSFGVLAAFLALRGGLDAARLIAVAGVSEFGFLPDEFSRRLRLNDRLKRDLRRRIERDMYPETTEIWQRFDATYCPDDIAVPILAIHDQDDTAAPIDQAHLLKATYGDQVHLITTTGLGHHKILTDPTVIAAALDFLAAQAESGGTPQSRPDVQLQRV
jgi:pimeloyl-ACP methyl ester carboxylesterase